MEYWTNEHLLTYMSATIDKRPQGEIITEINYRWCTFSA